MKVCVSLQNRFDKAPDGTIWTKSNFPYEFWKRYLEVFREVKVLARVRQVSERPQNANRSNGEKVTFGELPYFKGPFEYLYLNFQLKRAMKRETASKDAVIFRVPSPLPELCVNEFYKKRRPYGLEVLGDPLDLFSPGTYRMRILPLIRMISFFQLRKQCRKACAATYVTLRTLQSRYPCPQFEVGVSDVSISTRDFSSSPRTFFASRRPFSFLFVGSLQNFQKGIDVLIIACKKLIESGLNFSLKIIGDGDQRPYLERMVRSIGLESRVRFLGHFPSPSDLASFFYEADLFILPSLAEGLPKALMEAMSKGVPCIASAVGGIPEILPQEDLVIPGAPLKLAEKIIEVVKIPNRLEAMSQRNLEFAKKFKNENLYPLFKKFLFKVREDAESFFSSKRE